MTRRPWRAWVGHDRCRVDWLRAMTSAWARVGFVTDSFLDDQGDLFEGGAQRHLYRLASLASELGAEIVVYQPGRTDEVTEYERIRVVRRRVGSRSAWTFLAGRAYGDGCTHLHFQYVERVPRALPLKCVTATSHGVYWDAPWIPAYRSWYPSPLVNGATLATWRRAQKARSLRGLSRCRAVLSVDTSLLHVVQSDIPKLRDRIEVVFNFADLDPALTASTVTAVPNVLKGMQTAKEEGRTVVLVPRNLSLARGGAWLVEIASRVVDGHGQDCHFFLTGVPVPVYGSADRYSRNLQRDLTTASQRVRDRIELLGGVPHYLMPAAFHMADIVVIPTFFYEASSLAALEAMVYGKALVATNVGGLNDVVADGWNGLLSRADACAIAAAIAGLARDASLRARLGEQARREALARFALPVWKERAGRFADRAGWLGSDA